MAQSKAPFLAALSADSHITEPPHTYTDYIEPKYRDRAPRVVRQKDGGDSFVFDGMAGQVPLGIIAAAGIPVDKIKLNGVPFEELHRGGWDGKARIADQDRDGVVGEVIYPSVGMMLCNHPDADYKQACMWAYNRWLAEEFCSAARDRLFGLGQTAVRSVTEAVADFQRFKEMGFKGVMLPGSPATEIDYHHPDFDPLWRASVELNLPISFHILTTRSDGNNPLDGIARDSGPGSNAVKTFAYGLRLITTLQSIVGQFIFGRVFERVPGLKLVVVEADAGWAPHFIGRMNHAWDRHRYMLGVNDMPKLPGDYFKEHVYMTFQDDRSAWQTAHLMNPRRLLWANDFPHTDASWPWSQDIFRRNAEGLSEEVVRWIVRENTAELYDIPPAPSAPGQKRGAKAAA
jgi:predicted TIM-barrel fold metal-dependent hydrolase